MNAVSPLQSLQERRARQVQLVGILERLCQKIEPTDSQVEVARQRHDSVGNWLARSRHRLLMDAFLYAQGSFALRTVVKPLSGQEYDVDLVAHMARLGFLPEPAQMKQALGDRLREHATYAGILEEMPRCWRLNFANEFYMDITPSVPNLHCPQNGELVPDKRLREWKPSNPRGYCNRFEARAILVPRFRSLHAAMDSAALSKSYVEPFPEQDGFKGILRRVVQIAKRHRDLHFQDAEAGLAPISVIITTLAARSYEKCVSLRVYDNELEVLLDVIKGMLDFIEVREVGGRRIWFIENESTVGENFAEKWNTCPGRSDAFFGWHSRIQSDVERLAASVGMEQVQKALGDTFGLAAARETFASIAADVSTARISGRLVMAGSGLTTVTRAGAVPVKKNTFYGN